MSLEMFVRPMNYHRLLSHRHSTTLPRTTKAVSPVSHGTVIHVVLIYISDSKHVLYPASSVSIRPLVEKCAPGITLGRGSNNHERDGGIAEQNWDGLLARCGELITIPKHILYEGTGLRYVRRR